MSEVDNVIWPFKTFCGAILDINYVPVDGGTVDVLTLLSKFQHPPPADRNPPSSSVIICHHPSSSIKIRYHLSFSYSLWQSRLSTHSPSCSVIIRHTPSASSILRHPLSLSVIICHHPSSSGIFRHPSSSTDILRHYPSSSVINRHYRYIHFHTSYRNEAYAFRLPSTFVAAF